MSFNSVIVFNKIIRTVISCQKISSPTAESSVAQTLYISKKLLTHKQMLKIIIKDVSLSTDYLKAVQHFLKDAIIITHSYNLSELKLHVLKSAAIYKTAQKKLSRKVTQKSKVICVEHVQLMIYKIIKDEEEKTHSVITQTEEK